MAPCLEDVVERFHDRMKAHRALGHALHRPGMDCRVNMEDVGAAVEVVVEEWEALYPALRALYVPD